MLSIHIHVYDRKWHWWASNYIYYILSWANIKNFWLLLLLLVVFCSENDMCTRTNWKIYIRLYLRKSIIYNMYCWSICAMNKGWCGSTIVLILFQAILIFSSSIHHVHQAKGVVKNQQFAQFMQNPLKNIKWHKVLKFEKMQHFMVNFSVYHNWSDFILISPARKWPSRIGPDRWKLEFIIFVFL